MTASGGACCQLLKLLSSGVCVWSGRRGASDISPRAGGNLSRPVEQWNFSTDSLPVLWRGPGDERGRQEGCIGDPSHHCGCVWKEGMVEEGRERDTVSWRVAISG